MRTELLDIIRVQIMNGIKPNFSRLAKQYNVDRKTVRRYFLKGPSACIRKPRILKSKIDPYKDIILEKLEYGSSAKSIHNYLKGKGFTGSYTIIKDFCRRYVHKKQQEVTLRFETNPGLQAQVDWKEDFKLTSKSGEEFIINIFLVVLGYSRYKFIKLTTDRNQTTVFKGLSESFEYFKGVPKEILFDNMRTVVDQSRTQFGKPVYNERFYEFTKDAGFIPRSCLAYMPKTKGKVESLARLMNRLTVYNKEFETLEELDVLVKAFNKELNEEISQGTGQSLGERFKEEQKYLNPLPDKNILEDYFNLRPNKRKVSSEALICVEGKRYSVPPKYINSEVFYQIENDEIKIFTDKGTLICKHPKSSSIYNFDPNHYRAIAKAVFGDSNFVEQMCENNLSIYDRIK